MEDNTPQESTKKILIVDDEQSLTRMVKRVLESSGPYQVRIENDSLQAFNAARDFNPDLIILDILMPNMDGGDVATRIRSYKKLENVPIIFISAMVAPEEASNNGFYESGGELFLAKPVKTEVLVHAVETTLN